MQGKGVVAIVVVLLLIAAGAFLFTRPAAETGAPVTTAGTELPMDVAQSEPADMAETAPAADEAVTEDTAAEETVADETGAAEGGLAETAAEDAAPAEPGADAALVESGADAGQAETAAAEDDTETAEESGSLLAAPKSLFIDVNAAMADRILGSLDAPITIIEYASMTCPHCARFHTTMLDTVKRELLATGKAKLIFRDYPLDQFALRAAMMARCAPEDKYFDLVEVIFSNQDRWTKSENTLKALAKLGNLAGMDDEYIAACMQNAELENAILSRLREAQQLYRIRSTPSFVFNTKENENVKMLSGVDSPGEIADVVNKLINMR